MGMKPTPDHWKPPLVLVVGMGMGAGDLSEEARQWIISAEVLAGGTRHLESFPEHGGGRIPLKGSLHSSLEQIVEVSRQRKTAVLASGDPFFFGIGRRLTALLGKEKVLALPNVTSLQVFFSRLKEPWDGVPVYSFHGRDASADPSSWLPRLSPSKPVAFFTDPWRSPDWMAREMVKAGCVHWEMAVGEDLGLPTERVRRLDLAQAAEGDFSPLNMVALFPTAPQEFQEPPLGLPEGAFHHEAGLITKMEVRVISLAHLQLHPGQVLWDVGAGSGSVSIEGARMVPSAKIFAMERHARRFENIQENVRRFRCFGVKALCGAAPEVFHGLPDPHRVFIGGSGGNLREILEGVARRLKPQGRVVQTMVSLENLEEARSFWRQRGFTVEVSQIQVNRGVPIGKGLRLEALNPVFVMAVFKPFQENAELHFLSEMKGKEGEGP